MSRPASRLVVLLVVCAAAACEKVPLLAPTQSTVTLQINTTTVPINGTAEVLATVTEQAGTPVHNGTTVTFTASFGSMDPAEARTEGGVARSTFRAGTQSGTAKVGAFSGSARATEVDVLVGGAAAQAVAVRLEPSSVPQTGGTVNVIAVVTDVAGNRLPGAPVVFSTDNGVLGSNSGATDQNGEARTTLTTNRQSVVRAVVAGKEGQATVSIINLPSVGISLTTTNPIVGLPVVFSVTPGSTQNGNPVQSVVVDFGDGSPTVNLGAITGATSVTHSYDRANTYTAAATITDTAGFRSTSSTNVAVQRAVVTVAVTPSASTGVVGTPITFTVAVTNPSNLPLQNVVLAFGDGTSTTLGPTGGSAPKTYTTPGDFTVIATATDQSGNRYQGQTEVLIARPVVTVAVTASSSTGTVGTPITFTVAVTNPNNVPLTSVVLAFGDGTSTTLGANGGSASKTYATPGTFTVTATATDQSGNTYRGQTQVLIAPATPLTVTLDAASGDPAVTVTCPGTVYPKTCTANLVGIGVRVILSAGCNSGLGAGQCANAISYTWSFGDGTSEVSTGPSVDHVFRTRGEYVITVTVQTNTGASGTQRLTLIVL